MRVLVTAASKYGGTVGIAEAVGRSLEDAGLQVDVLPIEEVDGVGGYDALVLGSGVYAGRWLKAARRFAESHADDIARMPAWLFSSGPIGDPPKPDEESAVKLDAIVQKTGAREHRVFAGRLDKSALRFGDRAIVSAVRSAEGDFRDWAEISAWADAIAGALTPSTEVAVPIATSP
jgi:menaquinone-dependent protoporphyrinogen oxidase